MSGFMKSLSKVGNIIPDDIERRRLDNLKDCILEKLRDKTSNTKLNDRDAQSIFAEWEACSFGDYDKNSGKSKNEKDLIAVRRRMLGREIEKVKEDFFRRYDKKRIHATETSPNVILNASEEYCDPSTTTNTKITESPPLPKAVFISDCTILPDHDVEYDGDVVYPVLGDQDGIPVASEVSYQSLESCEIATAQNSNNNNDNTRNADNDRCDCLTFRYFPHRKKKCATRKILYTGGAIVVAGAVLGAGIVIGAALANNDTIEEGIHELQQRGLRFKEQHAANQNVLEQRKHDMNLALQQLQNRTRDVEAAERAIVEREMESQRLQNVFASLAVTEKTTTTTKKIRPEFDVVFMLDTSGSMAGEKSEEMFTALCEVMKVLKLNDGISITLFNDHIYKILPITKKKRIEFPNCICDSLTRYTPAKLGFVCGGGTALWDATNCGLMELVQRPNKRSHPHLVVVTDGDDSCSRNDDFRSIRSKLLNPTAVSSQLSHLKVSFITVGNRNEPYVDRIHSLTREPNNSQIVLEEIHHYHAELVSDIVSCFRQINIEIEKTVTKYITIAA